MDILRVFKRREYIALNNVLIDRAALVANHRALQQLHPEAQIAPVLKSNAYGHGLSSIGPVLDRVSAPFLVVDSLFEAYQLQTAKVRTPILVMGYTHPSNYKTKHLPFHFAVFDLETARHLQTYQTRARIHIFVDTGMYREGVTVKELPAFLNEVKRMENLTIVGLATHLADADNAQPSASMLKQLKEFSRARAICSALGIQPTLRHASASAAAVKLFDPEFNLIRAGISSYGISPLATEDPYASKVTLRPVLSFVSTLAQIKHIPRGSLIGYNGTFRARNQ